MFAYIKGIFEEIENNQVVIDVNGVGYSIMVPESVIPKLPQIGEALKLYTYFQVREDGQELYGFLNKKEKQLFEKLLTVTGIGPKVATGILSVLSPEQVATAIITGDEKTLCSAPGIGKKSAQRLILELKDKLDNSFITLPQTSRVAPVSSDKMEALQALSSLGYQQFEAERALSGIDRSITDTSDLIRLALKNLDSRR